MILLFLNIQNIKKTKKIVDNKIFLNKLLRLTISGIFYDEYILGLPVGGKAIKCLQSKSKTMRVYK